MRFPSFWVQGVGLKIVRAGKDALILSDHLVTGPHANQYGLYILPLSLVAHHTPLTEAEVKKAMRVLIRLEYAAYDYQSGMVWVREMAAEQLRAPLSPRNTVVKNIRRWFWGLPQNLSLVKEFYSRYRLDLVLDDAPSDAPSDPPSDGGQSQSQSLLKKGVRGKKIWKSILTSIEASGMNRQSFNTWFKPICLVGLTKTTATLEVPNKFFRDRLTDLDFTRALKAGFKAAKHPVRKIEIIPLEDKS